MFSVGNFYNRSNIYLVPDRLLLNYNCKSIGENQLIENSLKANLEIEYEVSARVSIRGSKGHFDLVTDMIIKLV